MGLAGELTTIGLAEVFQNLAFNHHTGTLTLTEAERKARICFEDGRIRAIKVEDAEFDFLEIARHAQAAPTEILEKAAGARRRRTLKAFLRAAGGFNEEAYDAMVAGYVQEACLPLFGWASASFSFEPGKIKERVFGKEMLECAVDLDPTGVAMEAARRADEWESISSFVPREEQILVLAGPRPEDATAEEERLFGLLDGTRTLSEVVKEAPLKKFDVFKAVAGLVEAGFLMPATTERMLELAGQARAAGRVTLAAKRLEVCLEIEPDNVDACRELVRLYERSGRKYDAAKELTKLAALQNDRGDLQGALESYERAGVLAPKDLDVLERIFEMHTTLGNASQAVRTGRRLAEALVAAEAYEDALPFYERLLKGNERNAGLRESLAGCLLELGDGAQAAQHLLVVADRAYAQGEFEQALKFYRRVVQADPACGLAKERVEEIESGAARARQRFRKRHRLMVGVGLLLGLVLLQASREWFAQGALHTAQHAAVTALSRDHSDQPRLMVMHGYADVCNAYPWTRGAAEAAETLHALLLLEVARLTTAVEDAAKATTTAEIDFSLGRARKMLRGLERVAFPEDSRAHWERARDRLRRRVDELAAK